MITDLIDRQRHPTYLRYFMLPVITSKVKNGMIDIQSRYTSRGLWWHAYGMYNFVSNMGRMDHFKNQQPSSHHSCLLVSFWMVRDMTALTWPQLIGMMGFTVSVHDQVSDLQFQKAVLCHLTDILAISKISKKLFVFPLRLGDKTVKRLRFQFTVPWN